VKRRAVCQSLCALLWMPCTYAETPLALPVYRIVPEGWGDAKVTDITAVINSAISTLWPYFPGRKLERFVIMRSKSGPMVHFQRNPRKEIVMNLDTEGLLWCQFAYQFAHEFAHILARFDQDGTSNLWFEETLCETASLFTLRHMARQWRVRPPFPNWKSYASALDEYADKVIKGRHRIPHGELAQYYQKHATTLRSDPTNRDLNGAMASLVLEKFEQTPESWESLTWLNSAPSAPDETFPFYLNKWLKAAPAKHHAFIGNLARDFGVRL
jgi:hypothetical protein